MDLSKEKQLWQKGYKVAAGLDEAGRGALAGPVVAVALMLKNFGRQSNSKLKTLNKLEVNDSKKLSPKKRIELYQILVKHQAIEWGIGKVGAKVIDKINILQATKLAMKRAIRNLEKKLAKKQNIFRDRQKSNIIDFLVLDGKMKLDLKISQESIVGADQKVFSCAAASIIAKVIRDRSMKNYYQKKYPQYGFDKHKGYGTKYHLKMIKKYGASEIHRKSFRPIMMN